MQMQVDLFFVMTKWMNAMNPDVLVIGAGPSPRFALFAAADEATARLAACHPDLLEPQARAPFAEGGIWLVRPDGYVAVAGGRDRLADVGACLERIRGAPTASRRRASASTLVP